MATTIVLCISVCSAMDSVVAQGRKPARAKAPQFEDSEFQSIFFSDIKSMLQGELPSSKQQLAPLAGKTSGGEPNAGTTSADPLAWHKLISPDSLEDLIKASKLRLDKIVTTPAAFAGGGFADARKEFSMLGLLFAVLEVYPDENVRFKKSAPMARELIARAAANSKVGSIQSFNEAKNRLLDLGDILRGSTLAGEPKSETEWSSLVDRVPLMQLLEWAHTDNLSKMTGSPSKFDSNKAQIKSLAQLVSVLGKLSLEEDMPDATDEDYMEFVSQMIQHSQQVALAVDTNDAELARSAAAQLGQSCQDCHDNFR